MQHASESKKPSNTDLDPEFWYLELGIWNLVFLKASLCPSIRIIRLKIHKIKYLTISIGVIGMFLYLLNQLLTSTN
jgi:hypothetical protein